MVCYNYNSMDKVAFKITKGKADGKMFLDQFMTYVVKVIDQEISKLPKPIDTYTKEEAGVLITSAIDGIPQVDLSDYVRQQVMQSALVELKDSLQATLEEKESVLTDKILASSKGSEGSYKNLVKETTDLKKEIGVLQSFLEKEIDKVSKDIPLVKKEVLAEVNTLRDNVQEVVLELEEKVNKEIKKLIEDIKKLAITSGGFSVTGAASIAYVDAAIAAITVEPAGSDTEVQFNDGGSFGANPNFAWDNVNKVLELTGSTESFTIGNPTGSITVADAGATVSGLSPYSGDYTTHLFKIYAYRDVDSTRLYSTTPITGSIYLETGENYRKLNFQFAAVANASGYILIYDGGGFGYYPYSKDIGNSVNYTDDGQTDYTYSGVDYTPPNGNSVTFNLAPLWVGKTLDLATKNLEILKCGTEESVLKWDAVNQRFKLATSADALATLNANIVASTLTAASATITSLAGTHSTGTIASAVNVLTAASGNTGSFHDALIATTVTGGNAVRSVSNNTLRLNPSRKTAVINGGTELGQGTSGTMLSINAANAYAGLAMKAGSSGGLHFFQIINSSDVVRSVYRDDGVAIFGSTNYANYGRALFIDDGFVGSPFSGQLSSLAYYSQDDQSIYGWAVGNRTYDTGWQKANVVCVALNAGGGYMGTPDNTPLSFRTNNVDRLTITGVGDIVASARIQRFQGADVASANNLVLGAGNVFEITGTTQINLMSNLTWQNGSQVTLLFTSTPTVKHGQTTSGTNITIRLSLGLDFVATAGNTLTLVLSEIGGTQAWREVSRAVI